MSRLVSAYSLPITISTSSLLSAVVGTPSQFLYRQSPRDIRHHLCFETPLSETFTTSSSLISSPRRREKNPLSETFTTSSSLISSPRRREKNKANPRRGGHHCRLPSPTTPSPSLSLQPPTFFLLSLFLLLSFGFEIQASRVFLRHPTTEFCQVPPPHFSSFTFLLPLLLTHWALRLFFFLSLSLANYRLHLSSSSSLFPLASCRPPHLLFFLFLAHRLSASLSLPLFSHSRLPGPTIVGCRLSSSSSSANTQTLTPFTQFFLPPLMLLVTLI